LLKRLREQGRTAPATILGMRTEGTYSDPGAMWADDSDLTKGGSMCRLELRVTPPGEPPFETTIRTRVNSFHYTGDTIEVLYDPADHDKVAFDYEADARAAMASARSPAPAAPSALAPLDPELQQLMDLEEAERTGGSGPPASASAPAPASGAAAADQRIAQLQQLSDLHSRGDLTDAEFAAEKARVLNEP
jgi:hypothetical protein